MQALAGNVSPTVSERLLRALDPTALEGTEQTAQCPLWVGRDKFLSAVDDSEQARIAGEAVWCSAEPWLGAHASLAQDPSVLLDEFSDWALLLDRHSTTSVTALQDHSEIHWTNLPGYEPDARECAFRLGAITALLQTCAADEPVGVEHVECAALGGQTCRFVVDEWISCRDPHHARAFHEVCLLAAKIEGGEHMTRRLNEFAARRETQIRNVEGLERVRSFMEELEDIIFVFDQELWLLDANRAALRFVGMSMDELRGLSAQNLMSPDSYRAVKATVPMLREMGALRGMQLEHRTRDGWATLEISARVSETGNTIVCIARDVTARLRLERELAERNLQLREQNARIADADRLKSEFLANVSHELTTPLTCIKGFAKLLHRDYTSGEADPSARLADSQRQDFLEIMQRESDRMTSMIAGLLELSNIESGGVALDRVEISANSIVAECAQLFKPRLDEVGIDLFTRLDDRLPRTRLDPDRMKQVVLNLLENAVKFSPRGSRISMETILGEGAFQLRVANPTRELEPGDLERIFARFVQRDGSYTRKHGGVGLGLNLVRAIVDLHGGRVWAELPDEDQVVFIVELPLAV